MVDNVVSFVSKFRDENDLVTEINKRISVWERDVDILEKAYMDVDEAASSLSKATSGDYSNFTVISNENRGAYAETQDTYWKKITDEVQSNKIAFDSITLGGWSG